MYYRAAGVCHCFAEILNAINVATVGEEAVGFAHVHDFIPCTILPVSFEIKLQKKITIRMLAAVVMSVEKIQLSVVFSCCLLVSY